MGLIWKKGIDLEETKYRTVFEVLDVVGECPIYEKGDKIVIDGHAVNLKETDAICMHAIGTSFTTMSMLYETGEEENFMEYQIPSSKGEKFSSFQCPRAAPPRSPGYVIFGIKRVSVEQKE